MIQISQQVINLVKNAEGFRYKAYRHKRADETWEPWTVGYGFTYDEQGRPFNESSTISRERADKFIVVMLQERAKEIINSLPGVPLNDNQLSALVSLHHNIGPGQWMTSSVRRFLLQKNYQKAADAFLLWKRGNTANDLLGRRQIERQLFLTPPTK